MKVAHNLVRVNSKSTVNLDSDIGKYVETSSLFKALTKVYEDVKTQQRAKQSDKQYNTLPRE